MQNFGSDPDYVIEMTRNATLATYNRERADARKEARRTGESVETILAARGVVAPEIALRIHRAAHVRES